LSDERVCPTRQQEEASMMNHQVPDDLISAYFDGEVTPDERGDVERLLESSADLRQQLDDTAKLSALLHSFPRQASPADLALNVQRRVESAAIINAFVINTPVTPARGRSLRREWTAFGAGTLVTLASLLLLVVVSPSPTNNRGEVALSLAVPGTFMGEPHQESESLTWDAHRNPPAGVDGEDRFQRFSRMHTPAPSEPVATGLATAVPNPSRFGFGVDANNFSDGVVMQPQPPTDWLLSLKNGDVIVQRNLDANNSVAVVQFTVIDIDKCSDEMKLLLQKKWSMQQVGDEMPALAQRTNASSRRMAEAPVKGEDSTEVNDEQEFQVFYVRAPGTQLAETIEESARHPDVFGNWTPQLPIELPTNTAAVSPGVVVLNDADLKFAAPVQTGQAMGDQQDLATEANLATTLLLARIQLSNTSGNIANHDQLPSNTPGVLAADSNFDGRDAPSLTASADANANNFVDSASKAVGGQGYFHVSRGNRFAGQRQNPSPAMNNTLAFQSNGVSLPNGTMNRPSSNSTNFDARDSRSMMRMLIVLKRDQVTPPP
jgi:hypothetical protein